jgi:hypothetical protein
MRLMRAANVARTEFIGATVQDCRTLLSCAAFALLYLSMPVWFQYYDVFNRFFTLAGAFNRKIHSWGAFPELYNRMKLYFEPKSRRGLPGDIRSESTARPRVPVIATTRGLCPSVVYYGRKSRACEMEIHVDSNDRKDSGKVRWCKRRFDASKRFVLDGRSGPSVRLARVGNYFHQTPLD